MFELTRTHDARKALQNWVKRWTWAGAQQSHTNVPKRNLQFKIGLQAPWILAEKQLFQWKRFFKTNTLWRKGKLFASGPDRIIQGTLSRGVKLANRHPQQRNWAILKRKRLRFVKEEEDDKRESRWICQWNWRVDRKSGRQLLSDKTSTVMETMGFEKVFAAVVQRTSYQVLFVGFGGTQEKQQTFQKQMETCRPYSQCVWPSEMSWPNWRKMKPALTKVRSPVCSSVTCYQLKTHRSKGSAMSSAVILSYAMIRVTTSLFFTWHCSFKADAPLLLRQREIHQTMWAVNWWKFLSPCEMPRHSIRYSCRHFCIFRNPVLHTATLFFSLPKISWAGPWVYSSKIQLWTLEQDGRNYYHSTIKHETHFTVHLMPFSGRLLCGSHLVYQQIKTHWINVLAFTRRVGHETKWHHSVVNVCLIKTKWS